MLNILCDTSLKKKSTDKNKSKVEKLNESIFNLESRIKEIDQDRSIKKYKLLIRLKKEKLKGLNYQYLDARANFETNLDVKNDLKKRAVELTCMIDCRSNSIKRINKEVESNKLNRVEVESEISDTINDLNGINSEIADKYREIEIMDVEIEKISAVAIDVCNEFEKSNSHLREVSDCFALREQYFTSIRKSVESIQNTLESRGKSPISDLSLTLKTNISEINDLNKNINELNILENKKNNTFEILKRSLSETQNLKVELRDTIHARSSNIDSVSNNCNKLMEKLTRTSTDIQELEVTVKEKREILGALRKSFAFADYKNEKTKKYWNSLNNEFQKIERTSLRLENKLELKRASLSNFDSQIKAISYEFNEHLNYDSYTVLPEDEAEVFLLQTFSNIIPNAILDICCFDQKIKKAIFGIRSLIKHSFEAVMQFSLYRSENSLTVNVSGKISNRDQLEEYMNPQSLLVDHELVNISRIQFQEINDVGIVKIDFCTSDESKTFISNSIPLSN